MLCGIFATLSECERELICETTRAGIASARARGCEGGAPFKVTAANVRLAIAVMGSQKTKSQIYAGNWGVTRQPSTDL